MALAIPAGCLSYFAFRYGIQHRLTPVVVSHLLCLGLVVGLFGVLFIDDRPQRLNALLSILSGPFALDMRHWKTSSISASVTSLLSLAIGLAFRPNLVTTQLLSLGPAYWYFYGFVSLLAF